MQCEKKKGKSNNKFITIGAFHMILSIEFGHKQKCLLFFVQFMYFTHPMNVYPITEICQHH